MLSESPDEYGIVTTIDNDGTATEFTRIEHEQDWAGVTASDDGRIIVAGQSGHDGMAAHWVGPDGAMASQHAVSVGSYDVEKSEQHACDPAEAQTTDTADRPANQTPTEPVSKSTQTSSRSGANATETASATGASGPGFGILPAGAAAILASLARYRTAEDED